MTSSPTKARDCVWTVRSTPTLPATCSRTIPLGASKSMTRRASGHSAMRLRAHARVRRSRQETLHALETFANIVDERHPSTYRHSVRVAAYVDELARALGLPFRDIDRLRWAARLHDL